MTPADNAPADSAPSPGAAADGAMSPGEAAPVSASRGPYDVLRTPPPRAPRRRRISLGLFQALALLVLAALVGAGAAVLVAQATGWGSQTVVKQYIATSGAISDHPTDIKGLLATALPCVVSVTATTTQFNPFFNPRAGAIVTAEGTGIILSDTGEIITNDHVVSGASSITVTFNDGTERAAAVAGADPENDLALLTVRDVKGLPALELADSSTVAAGDGVIAVGYALGLEGGPSVTAGIISATGRSTSTVTGSGSSQTLTDLLQTDAPISSGDSGGPLLNTDGQVIGINTMVATSTSETAVNGIGFAIAANTVTSLLPKLRAGG